VRAHHRRRTSSGADCCRRCLGGVHVRLLLRLHDVLLVPDPLVAEPVANLGHRDPALTCKVLFGLLAWVRVGKVRVEVLIQHLRRLLREVPPLSALVEKTGAEDHDCLTCRLLQLDLDGRKLLLDDLHHPLYLLGGDRPGAGLLAAQVHHMGRELLAALVVLLQLLVVDVPNLGELRLVVAVLDCVLVADKRRTSSGAPALVRSGHARSCCGC